jgi:hypothetical protein
MCDHTAETWKRMNAQKQENEITQAKEGELYAVCTICIIYIAVYVYIIKYNW